MSAPLEKFAVSRDGYTFPADEILTGRGFITGKSGSGKSNTASVIVEELLDRGLGLLIVDTDGEYRGLKEEYDVVHVGKGEECDMTVSPSDADQFARDALNNRLPVLLDVSTYHDEDATAQVIYELVNALFIAEHDLRVPFLVLLEEAHEFIPQQGGGDSDLESLLIRVAKRGRKRGLGICCLSQRPASVDKDYITQCDWFVWHRLTWENDTAVVGRIMGSEAAETVQSLDDGEAIVMTDWDEVTNRVQFRRQRTPDIGSTPSLDDMDLSNDEKDVEEVTERRTIGDMVKTPFGVSRDTDDSEGDGSDDAVASGSRTAPSTGDSPVTSESDDSKSTESTTAGDGEGETADTESTSTAGVDETTGNGTASTTSPGATTSTSGASDDGGTGTDDADERPWKYRTESINSSNQARRGASRSTASYSFSRSKPSLQRRRAKRETPPERTNTIWEIGAMMVYLYDSFVWYHLYVLYRMEMEIARGVSRLDTALWGGRRPRRPGRYERFSYKLLSVLGLAILYGVVALVLFLVV